MPALGRRSHAITKNELPKVKWEHSHVVVGTEGFVRSYCVYEAPSEEALRAHASSATTQSTDCTRSSAT
jgi:Protein of unknown function (DUF4242)